MTTSPAIARPLLLALGATAALALATPARAQDLNPLPLPTDLSFEGLFAEKEHEFFQQADRLPFVPRAQGVHLVNDWYLAEMSLLVYREDRGLVRHALRRAGFPRVAFFSRHGTQALVAHNADAIVVCFRGTEVAEREDLLADIRFCLEPANQGAIHEGFSAALDQVWEPGDEAPPSDAASDGFILPYLRRIRSDQAVWFTGHSLGGALATLAAARFHRGEAPAQGLVTFGSPRVGDAAFAATYPVPAVRFVNDNDVVTQVPWPLAMIDYRHVGTHVLIDVRGDLHVAPSVADILDDRVRGMVEATRGLLDGALDLRPIDHLTDHAPIYYATHLWNALVRQERQRGRRRGLIDLPLAQPSPADRP